MNDFLNRVRTDLKKRKNIELYLTLFIAVIILVIDILGIVNPESLVEIVLALAILLVFNLLNYSHSQERIEDKLDKAITKSSNYGSLVEWDKEQFGEFIRSSKQMCLFHVTSESAFNLYMDKFQEALSKGCKIRFLYVDPRSDAFQIISNKTRNSPGDITYLNNLFKVSTHRLNQLIRSIDKSENISIHLTTHVPTGALAIFYGDDQKSSFISLGMNGFRQSQEKRPNVVLSQKDNTRYFEFYETYFENLWSISKATTIEELQEIVQGLD